MSRKPFFPAWLAIAALALMPLPAAAQATQQPIHAESPAGRCGQPFALTRVYAVPLDVTPAAPFDTVVQRYEPQYLEFTLGSAQRVALRTEAPEGSDPVLALYDATGAALSWSDDDGGNLQALIDLDLSAGTYCAQVRALGFEASMTAPLSLRIAIGQAAADLAYVEPVPGAELACSDGAITTDLSVALGSGAGTITREGSLDGSVADYLFTVDAPAPLMLSVSSGSFDTVLDLYDAVGTYLDGNDDGPDGSTDSQITPVLQPGTYCLRVAAYDGFGVGPFALTLSDDPAIVPEAPMAFGGYCADPATLADLGTTGMGFGTIEIATRTPANGAAETMLTLTDYVDVLVGASSAEFDTVLRIYDRSGQLMGENDDGPAGTDSEIGLGLVPESYCIVVEGFAGSGGAATLSIQEVSYADPDPALACADPDAVLPLGRLQPGFGLIEAASGLGDPAVDYFSFSVDAPMTVTIDVTSGTFDTVAAISSASVGVIDRNDDNGMSTDSRLVPTLEPGAYCLSVWGFGGGTGTYEVAIAEGFAAEPDFDNPAYCSAPEVLTDLGTIDPGFGTASFDDAVIDGGMRDWLMTLSAPMSLRIEARSPTFDTYLRLSDAGGSILTENDDGPAGTDSLVDVVLDPGTYCVSVSPFMAGGGPVSLVLSETGADAPGAAARGEAVPTAADGIAVEEMGALSTALMSNAPSADRAKWLAFTLTDGGTVQVDGVSFSGPLTVRLFAEDGTMIGTGQAYGGMDSARVRESLQPGRYLISATLDASVEGRLRNISVRAVSE